MCVYIFKSINTLRDYNVINGVEFSVLKRNTKVLIIDDDDIVVLSSLYKQGYNIEHKKDIDSLNEIAAYDIVFCDVKGVGKSLSGKYEGAHLVKQIKKEFPDKMVISYSAIGYDSEYEEYLSYADAKVPKGSSIEDWTSIIDEWIEKKANPTVLWENTRTKLLNAGVPIAQIAKYETKYVCAVKSGKFESMKKLYERKSETGAKIMVELLKGVLALIKGV